MRTAPSVSVSISCAAARSSRDQSVPSGVIDASLSARGSAAGALADASASRMASARVTAPSGGGSDIDSRTVCPCTDVHLLRRRALAERRRVRSSTVCSPVDDAEAERRRRQAGGHAVEPHLGHVLRLDDERAARPALGRRGHASPTGS